TVKQIDGRVMLPNDRSNRIRLGRTTSRRVGAIADRSLYQLQTFTRVSSIILTAHHPRRDIVSVRLEVATIAAVMFGCTPQECEKNDASLF
ncbi:MAG: hypothetical protein WCA23_25290, partial [Stellaceae bacterium]